MSIYVDENSRNNSLRVQVVYDLAARVPKYQVLCTVLYIARYILG